MRSEVAALFWALRPNCVTVSPTVSPEGSDRERTATGFHCCKSAPDSVLGKLDHMHVS